MSNNKQMGIWMDGRKATVLGRAEVTSGEFIILGKLEDDGRGGNSNENAANNQARTSQQQFFKEIAKLLTNATHLWVTGTGAAQEQFNHFLTDTPQFKKVNTTLGTDGPLSDTALIQRVNEQFPG